MKNSQLSMLVILRLLIGWHLLYEGLVKLIQSNWSSASYLNESQGWFAGMFRAIASNPTFLDVADFMNVWGLILVGLGLILGFCTRLATLGGIVLLSLYFMSHPSLIWAEYAIAGEGNYLWVNKNLIEISALAVLFVFPTGKKIGLDRLIFGKA